MSNSSPESHGYGGVFQKVRSMIFQKVRSMMTYLYDNVLDDYDFFYFMQILLGFTTYAVNRGGNRRKCDDVIKPRIIVHSTWVEGRVHDMQEIFEGICRVTATR